MATNDTSAVDVEPMAPEEIDRVRLTGAIVFFGPVSEIQRVFKELEGRPAIRIIYRKTSGRHLKIVDESPNEEMEK